MIASDRHSIVIGLGSTGLSCARFLSQQGKQFSVCDTRENPPELHAFKREFPAIKIITGELDADYLSSAEQLIVSPGVTLSEPAIVAAKAKGVRVRGDIDLFAEYAKAPVAGITGSNGKSTVTTLLGEMAKASGLKVAVGGNLGTPALELLSDEIELYVIELSSFQLEGVEHLNAECVTLLNISEDHMDRYENKFAYLQAKQRIFVGAKNVVVNDDEPLSNPMVTEDMKVWHFGLNGMDLNKFSLNQERHGAILVKGFDTLISADELKLKGRHNISNVLCALAMGSALGLSVQAMLQTLKQFAGLPHRCELVRELGGVLYINDSKGTNTGATTTAITSLGEHAVGKVVLIVGGDAKGADVSVLVPSVAKYVKHLVLIGQDAKLIADALGDVVPSTFCASMSEAVQQASRLAREGDVVLLSPACASFDMFDDFKHRGETFTTEVAAL